MRYNKYTTTTTTTIQTFYEYKKAQLRKSKRCRHLNIRSLQTLNAHHSKPEIAFHYLVSFVLDKTNTVRNIVYYEEFRFRSAGNSEDWRDKLPECQLRVAYACVLTSSCVNYSTNKNLIWLPLRLLVERKRLDHSTYSHQWCRRLSACVRTILWWIHHSWYCVSS